MMMREQSVVVVVLLVFGCLLLFQQEEQIVSRHMKVRSYGGIVHQKTLRPRTEFFLPRPNPDPVQVQEFFAARGSVKDIELRPLRTCQDPAVFVPQLVFLHVPRTAGSTLRALLRAYAMYCSVGIAMIGRCLDVNANYPDGVWRNAYSSYRYGYACYLSFVGKEDEPDRRRLDKKALAVTTKDLLDLEIDVLAGHIPIGVHTVMETEQPQYVIFMRSPLEKLISELLVDETSTDIETCVRYVRNRVVGSLKDGYYYEKYSNYLITPEQKQWVVEHAVTWTPERRLNLTMRNLVDFNVIVGIVEHMTESLEVLEYVVDRRHETPGVFEFFSDEEKTARYAEFRNKERNQAVIRAILKDPGMTASVREYIRDEQAIYNFGLSIHKEQYRQLGNQSGFESFVERQRQKPGE